MRIEQTRELLKESAYEKRHTDGGDDIEERMMLFLEVIGEAKENTKEKDCLEEWREM